MIFAPYRGEDIDLSLFKPSLTTKCLSFSDELKARALLAADFLNLI